MASASPGAPGHLVWKRATVGGQPAFYGEAGQGLPVVFLHGWGLAHHAYKRALKRLVHLGCHVFAPAMPGFGGTPDLPPERLSLAAYAEWLDGFLDAVGVEEPVFVIGHSFGGGVAIVFAHAHTDRVRTLVLVNSVGGSAWKAGKTVRSMAQRPLWDWGLHFPSDLLPLPQIRRVLPVILEDAVPNLLRNPRGVWRAGHLARRADLTAELEDLKQRQLPVVVLWGDQDKIIPRASFEALCAAIGSDGEVVAGNHSWLLADPDAFGEVMTNAVGVAQLARTLEQGEPAARRSGVLGIGRSRPRRLRSMKGARPADEIRQGTDVGDAPRAAGDALP